MTSPAPLAPRDATARRIVLASAVVVALIASAVIGWRLNILGVRTGPPSGTVAAAFDQPPAYPGFIWTRNGVPVKAEELGTIAGPGHCDWQTATFLFIGWPPGTLSSISAQSRQYIRDPKGAIQGTTAYRELLVLNATIPSDARPTGYRLGAIEVYLSPSDQDEAIYVVGPDGAERWPRSDPMTLCV